MGTSCSKGGPCTDGPSRASVSPTPAEAASTLPLRPALGQMPPGYSARRRGSVSAEPSAHAGAKLKRVPRVDGDGSTCSIKAGDTRDKIQDLVRNTLLFKELDDDQQSAIIDAMVERHVAAGEVVIREGEEGDYFYVIERGQFEATKSSAARGSGSAPVPNGGGSRPSSGSAAIQAGAGHAPAPKRVALYDGKGSFGELALMYNCPRAATVTAVTEGVLWGVQRSTFRSLVVDSMVERRQRYEETLRSMPIFRHLSQEQLAAVADCLNQEVFEPGEYILWEGAPLDDSAKFYMIESGTVDCFRTFEGQKRPVKSLTAGQVFGEVALLTKAPRQADCVASTRCKCLTMSRDAFERLMGPVEQSLAQQIAAYAQSNAEAVAASANGTEGGAGDPASNEGSGDAGADAIDIASNRATVGDGSVTASVRSSVIGPDQVGSGPDQANTEAKAQPAPAEGEAVAAPVAAAQPAGVSGAPSAPAHPAPTSAPAPGPGSPTRTSTTSGGGAACAALLPGSPRPSGLVAVPEQGSPWRRSGRGTRSSAGSDTGDSLTSVSGAHAAAALQAALGQAHAADASLAASSSGRAAGAGEGADGSGVSEASGGAAEPLLPPIAEDPAEGGVAAAAAAPAAGDATAAVGVQESAQVGDGKDLAPGGSNSGEASGRSGSKVVAAPKAVYAAAGKASASSKPPAGKKAAASPRAGAKNKAGRK